MPVYLPEDGVTGSGQGAGFGFRVLVGIETFLSGFFCRKWATHFATFFKVYCTST